jgi:hypothetical protein
MCVLSKLAPPVMCIIQKPALDYNPEIGLQYQRNAVSVSLGTVSCPIMGLYQKSKGRVQGSCAVPECPAVARDQTRGEETELVSPREVVGVNILTYSGGALSSLDKDK